MKAVAAAIVVASLALAGCATQPPSFVANVTTLSGPGQDNAAGGVELNRAGSGPGTRGTATPLASIPARKLYRFASVSPELAGSLEYRAVRDAVAVGLTQIGLSPATLTPNVPAQLVVSFSYDNQSFQTWTDAATLSPWYGMGWGGSYWGPGWGLGFWGPPPVVYQPMPTEAWRHTLTISIRQADNDVEIYNTKAVHENFSNNGLEILPYMVDAALEGYPLASNYPREVRIPLGRR